MSESRFGHPCRLFIPPGELRHQEVDLMRLSRWLLGRYVRSLKKRRPAKIGPGSGQYRRPQLDGQQEFSFYHGYYRNHILHPLLIFDADTGDLVCGAVLRPGTSRGKAAISHRAHSEASRERPSDKQWGRMSRLSTSGPTAALPRLGSTSGSVNVKRINSSDVISGVKKQKTLACSESARAPAGFKPLG